MNSLGTNFCRSACAADLSIAICFIFLILFGYVGVKVLTSKRRRAHDLLVVKVSADFFWTFAIDGDH